MSKSYKGGNITTGKELGLIAMKRKIGFGRLLIVTFVLFSFFTIDHVIAFEAKVIGVIDGDTIEVLNNRKPVKIRLYGIDCPERDQDFGSKARKFTSNMVFKKTVEVTPVDMDKYGRTVAKIYVNGKYLNEMLVAEGLAWWYKPYAEKERDLEKAEKDARAAKIGLWSHPNPVAPWKFRRYKAVSD